MTVSLLRILAALVGFLVLVVLAVGGFGVALFCLRGGEATLSLPHLAELLSLDQLRDTVGPWLESLEATGPVAVLAALCGLGAMLLGVGLIVGALVPGRERLLIIDSSDRGRIAARRRAAASALAALAERPRETVSARGRVRPNRRRKGGRATLRLTQSAGLDERPVAVQSRADLERLGEAMSLRLRARTRRPRRGGRVI